jgi:8-hydroxy-5-deazaflavin:NADPH oxidoreductase
MRVGVLGTGGVGQTLAAKMASLGHEVMVGTRDVQAALARPKRAGVRRSSPSGIRRTRM